MASNFNEYTPQQYRKYNGQSVFRALSAIGKEASADELANFISEDIGKSEETILPEVKQVLRRGITNGFLVRSGQFYSFIGGDFDMQVDSAPRQRTNKPGASSKKTSNVEDVSEDGVSEDEESDLDQLEDTEEMETDNLMLVPPKVRLYEANNSPASDSGDSEEYDEDEPEPTPPKRIRLQPILKGIMKRN